MAMKIKKKSESPSGRNHVRAAVAPKIPLDKPGRLRISELQALFSISHTTVYERMRTGDLPPPDGWDLANRPKGRRGRPFWKTETIAVLLAGSK